MGRSDYNATRFAGEAFFRTTLLAWMKRYWRLKLHPDSAIPEGPCLIYGNHSNNFDAFMINAFIGWGDNTAGLMTAEYTHQHVFAPFFRSAGILPTRKHVPEPHLIRKIYRLLNNGRRVVIYPEGGRRWHGRPTRWIEATAKLFSRAGVPVFPIHTHGSYVAWPRWARYPRPAAIELEVLAPVNVDRSTPFEEALARLKAPIDMDENVVEERFRPEKAYRPAVGIQKLLYRDPFTGETGGVHVTDGRTIRSASGRLNGVVLPDSRIELNDTGEILLTGDLYEQLRKLPYDYGDGRAAFSVRADVAGTLDGGRIRESGALGSFHETHLSIAGAKKYHIPLENVRYVGTEKNRKLVLTLADDVLTLSFRQNGSVLQWYDELVRRAPDIRN